MEKANKALRTLVVMTVLLAVMFTPVFQSYKSEEALKIEALTKEKDNLINVELKDSNRAKDIIYHEIVAKQLEIKSFAGAI
jgi:hypothetical protein